MKRYPIGFNAPVPHDQVGDRTYFLDLCRQMQSAMHVIGSNSDLATEVYEVCEQKTKVVYRSILENDNDLWRDTHPHTFGDALMGLKDPRLILYGLNEPNPETPGELDHLVWFMTELVTYVCGHGRRLVVGNLGSGTWQWDDVMHGQYDPLLRAIDRHRDLCFLGLHEYSAIAIPMTYDTLIQPDAFKHPDYWQPNDWLYLDPDDPDHQLPDYRKEPLPYLPHFFRHHWFEHRCLQMSPPIEPVPILITECGTDRLQDVEDQTDIFHYFAQKFHYPDENGYIAPHGWYANKRVWQWYWENWSVSKALFEQVKWLSRNYYTPWVQGIGLFMASYQPEFSSRGYNLLPDRTLHLMMIHDAVAYVNQDEPEPEPEPEDPMPETKIDLLDYLRGDGHVYELTYQFPGLGNGISHVKTERTTGNRFFHVKGVVGHASQWEELWHDDAYIWRGTDTSPDDERLYQISEEKPLLEGGLYGAEWMYRYPEVGDMLYIESYVTFRKKADGSVDGTPYLFPHWIELKAVHDQMTFASGITLPDVVELWGYLEIDGKRHNFEQYFYAKGYGLVAWNEPTKNWKSFISKTQVEGALTRKQFGWLQLPSVVRESDLPEEDTWSFPLDEAWRYAFLTSKGTYTNVRPESNTKKNPVAKIEGMRHGLILPEEERQEADGIWYPIRLAQSPSEDFTQRDRFTISGWVRRDVIEDPQHYTPDPEPEPAPEPEPEPPKKFWSLPAPEASSTDDELLREAERHRYYANFLEGIVMVRNGEYDGIIVPRSSTTEAQRAQRI